MLQFSQNNGRYGYVACEDPNFWIIPPRYQEAWPFVNGRGRVYIRGSFYLIDQNGRIVSGPER